MEKKTIASISLTSGILWIFILQYLFLSVDGLRSATITALRGMYNALGDGLFTGTVLVLSGAIFGAFVFQLLSKRFEIVFTVLLTLAYFYALFYALFLKSPGTRGINMNLAEFGREFTYTPLDTMWNILLFLPIGLLLQLLIKSTWKSALAGFVLVVMVEGAQYIFSAGIFDVIDILMNTLGVFLGALIISSATLDGWSFGFDRHFLTFSK
ncbi:MAG: VanZ family protein [Bifidobacteriaceae bacterium]|nr:VanZ family protein [Bifidobacteriaceae bacterium]